MSSNFLYKLIDKQKSTTKLLPSAPLEPITNVEKSLEKNNVKGSNNSVET